MKSELLQMLSVMAVIFLVAAVAFVATWYFLPGSFQEMGISFPQLF